MRCFLRLGVTVTPTPERSAEPAPAPSPFVEMKFHCLNPNRGHAVEGFHIPVAEFQVLATCFLVSKCHFHVDSGDALRDTPVFLNSKLGWTRTPEPYFYDYSSMPAYEQMPLVRPSHLVYGSISRPKRMFGHKAWFFLYCFLST